MDPRQWTWTTRKLATLMLLIAVTGGLVDWLHGARAWMPNVVVGALTVTVVEHPIHSEERRRERPLAQRGLTAMGVALRGFTRTVVHDYVATHRPRVEPLPPTVLGWLDLWLAGQASEGVPGRERQAGQLPILVQHACELTDRLVALGEQYELVLYSS